MLWRELLLAGDKLAIQSSLEALVSSRKAQPKHYDSILQLKVLKKQQRTELCG